MISQSTATLRTLLVSDLVDSTKLTQQHGDERIAEAFRRHDRIARDLLLDHEGVEADRTDGFLLLFARPINAVAYALAFHRAMGELSEEIEIPMSFRIGIHLGEVVLIETPAEDVARGAKPLEVEGLAKPTAARLMSLARGGQTLLSQGAFNLARQAAVGRLEIADLEWVAHGQYKLKGVAEPMPVFEAGRRGVAPLEAPGDTEKVRRLVSDATVTGWRPSVGQEIPLRPRWVLEEKLGEGGFGEVWLARYLKTGERRAFKFCFKKAAVRALQREITLFRLLKETLGVRDDIARILDWSFDAAPYFIESEYSESGNLEQWSEAQGGLAEIPLATRLDLCAQIADALAAAHSVGVLHKDVKPSNVLIVGSAEQPRGLLTDFGIGEVADSQQLFESGITVLGMNETETLESTGWGTPLYQAPEVLEGKIATLQADIYALGVLLYQMVIGDFSHALATGWQRDVEDEVLRETIAAAVDGSPARRLADASRLAQRLRTLDERRQELEEERRLRRELENAEKARRRRRVLAGALGLALVVIFFLGYLAKRAIEGERRAVREAAANQELIVLFEDLFQNQNPYRTQGNKVAPEELIRRSADKLRVSLVEQPVVKARLQSVLGKICLDRGYYNLGTELLEETLELRRQELGNKHQDTVNSLIDLALGYRLRADEGDLAKSDQYYQEASAPLKEIFGEDSSPVANILNQHGVSYLTQGDCDKAESFFSQASAIWKAEDDPQRVRPLNNMAICYWNEEEYEKAEDFYQRARKEGEAAFGEMDPDVISIVNNLGIVYRDQGRLVAARELLLEALEKRIKVLGEDHPHTGTTWRNLALTSIRQGRLPEAEEELGHAVRILEAKLNPRHSDIGKAYGVMADLRFAQEDFAEAEKKARKALAILREAYDEEHRAIVEMTNLLEKVSSAQ